MLASARSRGGACLCDGVSHVAKAGSPSFASMVAAFMACVPKSVCNATLRCSSESTPSPPESWPMMVSKDCILPVES